MSLGIEDGILLSSGTANPSLSNTESGYSSYLDFTDGIDSDSDLSAVALAAFSGSGQIEDASWIQFDFTVADPYNTKGITFDLVFGSEEYPEYSNSSYVDIAGVFLNGNNVALFNGDQYSPLSVIDSNLGLGYFNDNSYSSFPIEYDGISNKLTIYAPVQPGVNTLKIGVADTGDDALDSGLFVSNLSATKIGGSGLSSVIVGSDESDDITGDDNGETFDLGAGDDVINPGLGDDIVLAGAGDDTIYGGSGNNQIDGGDGVDTVIYDGSAQMNFIKILDNNTIKVGANSDTLIDVELLQFDDMSFNTGQLFIEDSVAKIYLAYFGRAADPLGLQYWLGDVQNYIDNGYNYNDSLKNIIDSFALSAEAESMYSGMNAGNLNDAELTNFITSVYQNLFDRDPDAAGLAYWLEDAKNLQSEGIAVGTLIKTIIDGAIDSSTTQMDRTLVQNKAQVAWDYAKQFELSDKNWDSASMTAEATNIVDSITSDGSSVNDAYNQILTIVGVELSSAI